VESPQLNPATSNAARALIAIGTIGLPCAATQPTIGPTIGISRINPTLQSDIMRPHVVATAFLCYVVLLANRSPRLAPPEKIRRTTAVC
jgi:hypothetical protein